MNSYLWLTSEKFCPMYATLEVIDMLVGHYTPQTYMVESPVQDINRRTKWQSVDACRR